MPSTVTHTYFANDVFDRLPLKKREFLMNDKDRMKISAQSMDTLFFYNITNFNKGKKVRDFGLYFHKNKSFLFFETLINYIKYNRYSDNPEVMAYLYGMICHYVLDRNCHPFIIYNSGVYIKGDYSTLKYNHMHGEKETLIDNYLILKREGVVPWKFDIIPFCFPDNSITETLKEVIDFSFKETFSLSHMSDYYEKSISHMKLFYTIFRKDFYGIKKMGYHVVDFLSPNSFLRKSVLSYHQRVVNNNILLNLSHQKWFHPVTKRISSTESFLDLYLKSLFQVVTIIEELDLYIYQSKKINLKKLLRNDSYETGLDCKKENELKFFAF